MLKKGFTLIELIGTLAIIMVIITVASVSVGGTLRNNQVKTNQLKIANMLSSTEDYIVKNRIPIAVNVPIYFSVNGLVQENILTDNPNKTIRAVKNITNDETFFIEAIKTTKNDNLALKVVTEQEFLNKTGVPSTDNVIQDTWAIDYRPSTKDNSNTLVTKERDRTSIKFKLAKPDYSYFYNLYLTQVKYELRVKKTAYNKAYAVNSIIKSGTINNLKVSDDGTYTFKINTDVAPGIYELKIKVNTEVKSEISSPNTLTIVIGDSVDKDLITTVSAPPPTWSKNSSLSVDVWGKRKITGEYADKITYYGYRYATINDRINKVNGVAIGSSSNPVEVNASLKSGTKDYARINFSVSGVYDLKFGSNISNTRNATSDDEDIKSINEEIVILMLDNIAPTVTINTNDEGSINSWAQSRTIGVSITDSNSLIQVKPNEVNANGKVIFNNANAIIRTKDLSPNHAIDKAGNITTIRALNVYVDSENPSCSSSSSNSKWTNQNVRVSGSCSDGTGSGCVGSNPYFNFTSNINITNAGPGLNGGTAKVTDKAGNATSCPANQTVKIDKSNPSCTSSGGSNSWRNTNLTISGSCSDTGGSGCRTASITNMFSSNTNTTIASPGTVSDNAGNSASCPANQTVKIDMTAPSCTSSGGSSAWTSGSRTISGTCSDTLSGCAGNTSQLYNSQINTSTATPGTVRDNAGNSASCPANQTVRIDRTAPSCTSSGGSTTWTNGSRTISGTCSDTLSGCVGNTSQLYNSQINTSTATPGTVSDNVGNTTSCPANQTVRIDRTAPSCTSSGESSAWRNSNLTITGTCSDTGGSGCSAATITDTFSSNTNTTTASPGTVRDNAGNTRSCPANQTVRIDKTDPTCTSYGENGSWTAGSRTIYGNCSDTGGSGCATDPISKTYSSSIKTTTASPGTVRDDAGNTRSCPANQTVRIDKTDPSVSASCAGTSAFSVSTSDTYSGVDTTTYSSSTNGYCNTNSRWVRRNTRTYTARDYAGNSRSDTATCNYQLTQILC